MEHLYKTAPDVHDSAREFLSNSRRFTEIYHSQEPFALGFLSNHAKTICNQFCVQEAYIDSTFKTNSSKHELFAILGSFLGTGFPIAYLLLEAGGNERKMQRKFSIERFLEATRREVEHFKPTFFFTDKNLGQISAISSVYGVNPSICLWHMKRSIKRKLGELHDQGVEISTKEQRSRILNLVTHHFNNHPFFCTEAETIESLHLKNLQEISEFCEDQSLPTIYSYLLSNWYTWNK